MSEMLESQVAAFFAYARERHQIYLRREADRAELDAGGRPQGPPWTDDPILQEYSFTNIFRELDRTTVWFRENVRDMIDGPEALLAIVLFRWFNRIRTGEFLFQQADLVSRKSLFEMVLDADRNHKKILEAPLRRFGAPWFTGSYLINSRGLGDGMDKLAGVLTLFEHWATSRDWRSYSKSIHDASTWSMESAHRWLGINAPGLGGFMCYEIVCDMRWAPYFGEPADCDTWAFAGPGARRGLGRLCGFSGRHDGGLVHRRDTLPMMQELLEISDYDNMWPEKWPQWEMREVEHTLCEFDKYERTRLGQGRPRVKFKGGK